MEELVTHYKKKNQSLEDREMELMYRLQMQENTMLAILMANIFKMMARQARQPAPSTGIPPGTDGTPKATAILNPVEEELMSRLCTLEARLETELMMLQESREKENVLWKKLYKLEMILNSKDTDTGHILDRNPGRDLDILEKVIKMAREGIEMQRRIKELEVKEALYQKTIDKYDRLFSDKD
ncbi:unnamed protein product [Nezara viridula]|uniref:Uncharacterized protein n=1 Tax=Nezara viridula TaxID=85310 RepID=A0A9P0H7U9_NEZVI|nr:unnamed protein product [Nezara viridula]